MRERDIGWHLQTTYAAVPLYASELQEGDWVTTTKKGVQIKEAKSVEDDIASVDQTLQHLEPHCKSSGCPPELP